jgi:hypothetical protein
MEFTVVSPQGWEMGSKTSEPNEFENIRVALQGLRKYISHIVSEKVYQI